MIQDNLMINHQHNSLYKGEFKQADHRLPYNQPAYGTKNSSKVLNHFQMLVGSISNHPFHSLFVIPGEILFCKLLNIQLIDKLKDNLFNRLFNLKTSVFKLIR